MNQKVREYLLKEETFQKFGFRKSLKDTEVVKKIFLGLPSLFALVISLVFCIILSQSSEIIDDLKSLILTLIGGTIGLMAFSLAAIAIVLSIIKDDFIVRISKIDLENGKDNIGKVRDLLFYYYFSGFLDLIVVFLLCFDFIILKIKIYSCIAGILTFVTVYMVVIALMVSLMLIGTTIKIRILVV